MRDRSQVFLKNLESLEFLSHGEGLTFQVGMGSGMITKILPHPRMGIQKDLRFSQVLEGEEVVWGDFLKYEGGVSPKRIVGNLPFSNSIAYIMHGYRIFPHTAQAWYIVQREVGESMMRPGKLGILLRWIYDITLVTTIPGSDFSPRVPVQGALMHLRRIERPLDEVCNLRKGLGKIINPRKMLGHYYPLCHALERLRVDSLDPGQEKVLINHILGVYLTPR